MKKIINKKNFQWVYFFINNVFKNASYYILKWMLINTVLNGEEFVKTISNLIFEIKLFTSGKSLQVERGLVLRFADFHSRA